jgi:predicted ATPase/DNA-binding CsgD family transcriptional regulator/DNA-binding XRE family transcriptional regulator
MPQTDPAGSFGDLLRTYRLAGRLSQDELAERAGLSRRGISDLERGARRLPHPATVRRLVDGLGLSEAEGADLVAAVQRNGFAAESSAVPRQSPGLPTPLTSFVGRQLEIAEIQQVLSRTRLVTVLGPGGVGKTRLALRIASDLKETASQNYPDGVWLVDLAPLRDPRLVPNTIARALGLREPVRPAPLIALSEALVERALLIVLDNCEYLAATCAEVAATLLGHCPHVRILATSRIVLGVEGETSWRVSPLQLPATTGPRLLGAVRESESGRLFLDRARTVRPNFVADERTANAIAAICRSVDGLPLGIELAAARMSVLTVDQIAQRLPQALGFLTGGSRTGHPGHHGLRATLDWSYELLTAAERNVFERASVFSSGWALEAAETVCAGENVAPVAVLDILEQLVNKSLVCTDAGDEVAMRFRLLEPLRQFAVELLESRDEVEQVRRRHASYYLQIGEELGAQWSRRDPERLMRMELELGNIRAALRWLIDRREIEPAVQLAGAAACVWLERGFGTEGRTWLGEVLALPSSEKSAARVRALLYASALAAEQGDHPAAYPPLEAAAAMARDIDDFPGLAYALFRLAEMAWIRRDFVTTRIFSDEGVQVARRAGNRNLEGINLWRSAQATHDLGEPEAEMLAQQALAILTEVQNPTMMGCALTTLAQAHLVRDELSAARQLIDRAVGLQRPEFHGVAQLFMNVNRGWVAVAQSDLAAAYESLMYALEMARDALGGQARLVTPLEGLAQLAAAVGQPVCALRLAGAASALRNEFATPPTPTEVRQLQLWLTHARAQLSGPDADAAWRSGERLTPAQTIVEALALERPIASRPNSVADGLTRREREVARLVASGATTREIADRLVISRNTARVHIERILNKLDLHSRAQLVLWARQRADFADIA